MPITDEQIAEFALAMTEPPAKPDERLGYLMSSPWWLVLDRSKRGDVMASRLLMRLAAAGLRKSRVGQNAVLPDFVADYLADALAAVADGKDPRDALRLRRNPGSGKFVRDDWIRYVVRMYEHEGLSPSVAHERAADLLNECNVKGPHKESAWGADTVRKIVDKRILGKRAR
jgi:hypothetical protein